MGHHNDDEWVALFNGGDTKAALKLVGADCDTSCIAKILHRTPGLDMAVLGELLGAREQADLLSEYLRMMNFRGQSLERSLRKLLAGFRLPGEAQKIDRYLIGYSIRTRCEPPSPLCISLCY